MLLARLWTTVCPVDSRTVFFVSHLRIGVCLLWFLSITYVLWGSLGYVVWMRCADDCIGAKGRKFPATLVRLQSWAQFVLSEFSSWFDLLGSGSPSGSPPAGYVPVSVRMI